MTMSKRFGILVLVGAIGLFAFELGGRLSVPGVHSIASDRPCRRRTSAHSGQRGRGSRGVRRGAARRAFTTAKVGGILTDAQRHLLRAGHSGPGPQDPMRPPPAASASADTKVAPSGCRQPRLWRPTRAGSIESK